MHTATALGLGSGSDDLEDLTLLAAFDRPSHRSGPSNAGQGTGFCRPHAPSWLRSPQS